MKPHTVSKKFSDLKARASNVTNLSQAGARVCWLSAGSTWKWRSIDGWRDTGAIVDAHDLEDGFRRGVE